MFKVTKILVVTVLITLRSFIPTVSMDVAEQTPDGRPEEVRKREDEDDDDENDDES